MAVATSVFNKACPFRSTPDKVANCIKECQFCNSNKCDLANIANLATQVKVLNEKIDELSKKLK